ncbi:hypothetical protein EYZ11_011017 [Aspergillus tanneri]|uniref:Uncharacterized protein n=1 Tax=Aspergillus tanneri TaxID=1220188 RepID=A0A4S3J624_9EURO|nr:hypothetical protein EYZ11_011017 [Aspergillus tanneri]
MATKRFGAVTLKLPPPNQTNEKTTRWEPEKQSGKGPASRWTQPIHGQEIIQLSEEREALDVMD